MKKILWLPLLFITLFLFTPLYANSVTETKEDLIIVSTQDLLLPIAEEIEEMNVIDINIEEEKKKFFRLEHSEIKQLQNKKEYFLAYKELIFEYAEWIDPPETVFDAYTEEEVRLICKAVETECYQQSFDSKVNVASVIFNRIEIGGEFGDSVTEVITKPNQFAYGRDTLTEDTILAVQYAYEIEDTTDGCIAFRSGKLPEKWYLSKDSYWVRIFIDEAGHGFYK